VHAVHTVFIGFDFGASAEKVLEALKPELQAAPSGRSRIELSAGEGRLKLFIEAEDVVSMRAALNTWLRLIKIAEEMLDTRSKS
jgi:KEOPS complex subunit Pcc1